MLSASYCSPGLVSVRLKSKHPCSLRGFALCFTSHSHRPSHHDITILNAAAAVFERRGYLSPASSTRPLRRCARRTAASSTNCSAARQPRTAACRSNGGGTARHWTRTSRCSGRALRRRTARCGSARRRRRSTRSRAAAGAPADLRSRPAAELDALPTKQLGHAVKADAPVAEVREGTTTRRRGFQGDIDNDICDLATAVGQNVSADSHGGRREDAREDRKQAAAE